MKRAALSLAAVLLTACGGTTGTADDTPAAGTNRPAETASAEPESAEPESAEPESAEPEASPTEEETGPLTFGETTTYEDGLEVTVGAPKPFKASETAAGAEGFPAAVAFDVVIVNGTGANFDPSLFSTTLQSANTEGSEVYDSEQNVGGSPSTTLLPGREAKFRIAYAVQDPADLVLEVSPSFEHNAALFTNS